MMVPIEPTPIDLLPLGPRATDAEDEFDEKSFATIEAQEAMVPQINAAISATYQNTVAAHELAQIAGTKAGEANDSAAAAAADAQRLASLDVLWLGALAADPATGRDGAPLVAGNAYVNTATGYIRAYNGTAWVQGVSAVAGVTSLNGQIGDLALKTVGGQSVVGVGDISFSTFEIGDARPTVSPPNVDWIEANKIYLQSSYPELFAQVGLQPDSVSVSFDAGPAASGLSGIASNGQEIVAVSTTPMIRRRTGGVWVTSIPPVSARWSGVGHGNNVFVVVAGGHGEAASTVALTSADKGATWIQRNLPSGSWFLVACEETSGYWMAIGSSQCAVSRDGGATWVAASLPSGMSNMGSLTLTPAGGGKFLLTNRSNLGVNVWMGTVTASTVTWAVVSMPSSQYWFGAGVQGGVLIVAGYNGTSMSLCSTTDGGATFTTRAFTVEGMEYLFFGCSADLMVVGSSNGTTLTFLKNGPPERRSPPVSFPMTWARGAAVGPDYVIAGGSGSNANGILRVSGKSYDPASQFYLPEPTVVTPPFKNWVKAK